MNSGYHPADFFPAALVKPSAREMFGGEKLKNQAKDGRLFWLDTTIVPFLNSRGETPSICKQFAKDITDRKQAEEAVRLSESQLRTKKSRIGKSPAGRA